MTSFTYRGIAHTFDLKISNLCASPYFPLWFSNYQWSYLIMLDLICPSRLHLTGDSQYFSKEEMMSMAHFYPWKMWYMMPEASAIKPMHITAISDSRHDQWTHMPSFRVIAFISSHLHLIAWPSLDYSDLCGLSNLSAELTDHSLASVTWLSISDHCLAGALRWNLIPDSCWRSHPVTSPFLA
jgi:hypothetical protein